MPRKKFSARHTSLGQVGIVGKRVLANSGDVALVAEIDGEERVLLAAPSFWNMTAAELKRLIAEVPELKPPKAKDGVDTELMINDDDVRALGIGATD